MLDPHEAAKKIAAASVDVRRAKEARLDNTKVQAAKRRLAILLRLFAGFKNHPDFKAAYARRSRRFAPMHRDALSNCSRASYSRAMIGPSELDQLKIAYFIEERATLALLLEMLEICVADKQVIARANEKLEKTDALLADLLSKSRGAVH